MQATQYRHTNTTDHYQVVGNRSVVISSHATEREAVEAMKKAVPSICDSKWGAVDIVPPGQTVEGKMVDGLSSEQIAKISEPIDLFGF